MRGDAQRRRAAEGACVVVLGPDGSGKSTAIAALHRSLTGQGREVRLFHLHTNVLHRPNRQGTELIGPHGARSRGRVSSLIKLVYLSAEYIIGYWRNVRPSLRRGAIVVFDRYYQDILVDPRRYRMHASARIVQMFESVIPEPDLYLIFDIVPEVARARKAEVSEEESDRQFHAYRALAAALRNAVLIDANRPANEVAWVCENAVNELAARKGAV